MDLHRLIATGIRKVSTEHECALWIVEVVGYGKRTVQRMSISIWCEAQQWSQQGLEAEK